MNVYKNIICAYCGASNPETRDHIPPKGIFGEPLPSNLITVLCCTNCHGKTSQDDEYFRDSLVMRKDLGTNPVTQQLLQKVHRALAKPTKLKYVKALIRSTREVDLMTKSGVYIGRGAYYNIEFDRLDRVAERIVRGLYYHYEKEPFPQSKFISCYLLELIDTSSHKGFDKVFNALSESREIVIDANVFKFRRYLNSVEGIEIWLLTFYNRVNFISFIHGHSKN